MISNSEINSPVINDSVHNTWTLYRASQKKLSFRICPKWPDLLRIAQNVQNWRKKLPRITQNAQNCPRLVFWYVLLWILKEIFSGMPCRHNCHLIAIHVPARIQYCHYCTEIPTMHVFINDRTITKVSNFKIQDFQITALGKEIAWEGVVITPACWLLTVGRECLSAAAYL